MFTPTPLDTILTYFQTGDIPTQEEFKASWSSFWHKNDSVPTSKIEGLDHQLQNKADKSAFETHLSNQDSHISYLAAKDAANLDSNNLQAWKIALGVGEQPENTATIDDANNAGNVYTKQQSDTKYMLLSDFVDKDQKILAEKIEALGLTSLIEAVETDISLFADHSASYEFQDNDFIAIPDSAGNFSLYLFKGGVKNNKYNYLPTGISNVTIGMVEGLQGELNKKIDKPLTDGKFYIKRTSGVTTTETLADETLASVVSRDAYSPKPITFLDGSERTYANIGVNPATYSFFWGNINPNHTGFYNHTFGYNCLSKVTTGNNNIAFGAAAGQELTISSFNTFVGVVAGQNAVSGNYNVMIGEETGFKVTSGFKNTLVGTASGYNVTTGNLNTLIGYKASNTTTLGDRNIIIGASSGQGVTGQNNILIGVGAGHNDGALSNKLIIHSNNTMTGYNNTSEGVFGSFQQGTLGMALITGDFLQRWVKFNGTFSINPSYIPAGDASYKKIFVGNSSGQFGWIDKVDSIPLSGTLPGKPVTGEIEFSTDGGGVIKSGVANISVSDGFTTIFSGDLMGDRTQILSSPMQISLSQGSDKYINLTQWLDRIDVGAPSEGPGIVGQNYYGDHYTENSFVQKKWVEEKVKNITGNGYKIYRALLNNNRGTFDPNFIVLENTIGNIEWDRVDSGKFIGKMSGAFTENKVWINAKINALYTKNHVDCYSFRGSEDHVSLNVFDVTDKSPVDFEEQYGFIEIYVYD
ncbi:hypothetical protein [Chryseobacterium gambrini]|uniref:hypothetical protein n=1 Tax=Chryseobacterium gambrini TaxID=373672 RepID=UPI0022F15B1F|nr:hypothetical protein [Chryseobacterium gambrini]WBV53822.1 hypothetical protein PFY09_05745 [Chryseobacterium gambrini]